MMFKMKELMLDQCAHFQEPCQFEIENVSGANSLKF